jgi:hypothetical protein
MLISFNNTTLHSGIPRGTGFALGYCPPPTSLLEEEELRVQRGPGVNEVALRERPHHNVHSRLGVDTGATSPR